MRVSAPISCQIEVGFYFARSLPRQPPVGVSGLVFCDKKGKSEVTATWKDGSKTVKTVETDTVRSNKSHKDCDERVRKSIASLIRYWIEAEVFAGKAKE